MGAAAETATVLGVSGARATSLPGEELIRRGLEDLDGEVESIESLLVSIGAPRLRGLGLTIGRAHAAPEEKLYRLLATRHGDGAHSRYNALIRRLTSYERALALASRAPTG